jgi:hypothetical protein
MRLTVEKELSNAQQVFSPRNCLLLIKQLRARMVLTQRPKFPCTHRSECTARIFRSPPLEVASRKIEKGLKFGWNDPCWKTGYTAIVFFRLHRNTITRQAKNWFQRQKNTLKVSGHDHVMLSMMDPTAAADGCMEQHLDHQLVVITDNSWDCWDSTIAFFILYLLAHSWYLQARFFYLPFLIARSSP